MVTVLVLENQFQDVACTFLPAQSDLQSNIGKISMTNTDQHAHLHSTSLEWQTQISMHIYAFYQ